MIENIRIFEVDSKDKLSYNEEEIKKVLVPSLGDNGEILGYYMGVYTNALKPETDYSIRFIMSDWFPPRYEKYFISKNGTYVAYCIPSYQAGFHSVDFTFSAVDEIFSKKFYFKSGASGDNFVFLLFYVPSFKDGTSYTEGSAEDLLNSIMKYFDNIVIEEK